MYDRVLALLESVAKKHLIKIETDDSASILILLANAYKCAQRLSESGVALEIKGRPAVSDSIVRAFIETMQIRHGLDDVDTTILSKFGVPSNEDKA